MGVYTLKHNRVVQIPALFVTIALMQLLPFLVHVLPPLANVPLGARLLPLFYAPFFAAVFFHPFVAIAAGLIAPFLNHWLLGFPAMPMAALLSLELVVFSAIVAVLYKLWPRLPMIAPLSYGVAKLASLLVLALLPLQLISAPPLQFTLTSLKNGWPGIVILFVLNLLVATANETSTREI